MTTIVGCHVRNAGVWKKTIPYVKVSGNWLKCQKVYTKVSGVWKVVWADAERALRIMSPAPNVSSFDFFSPFTSSAGWRFNANGSCDKFEEPAQSPFGWISANNDWLNYDTGFHDYEVKFSDKGSENLDTNPTLESFIDIGVSALQFSSSLLVDGNEFGNFDVDIIDKSAPGPAPILTTTVLTVTVDAGQI